MNCRICDIELNINTQTYSQINKSRICKNCRNVNESKIRREKGIPKKESHTLNCNFCNEDLKEGVNWFHSFAKEHKYICKKCNSKKNREFHTIYSRQNYLQIKDKNGNQKTVRVVKSSHTFICELCGKKSTRTEYHHWNDEHPEWGIWVCYWCHRLCECIEHELTKEHVDKYIELKKKVENEKN